MRVILVGAMIGIIYVAIARALDGPLSTADVLQLMALGGILANVAMDRK